MLKPMALCTDTAPLNFFNTRYYLLRTAILCKQQLPHVNDSPLLSIAPALVNSVVKKIDTDL